jgi:hypothetical protein
MLWIDQYRAVVTEYCDDFNDSVFPEWTNPAWGVTGITHTGTTISKGGFAADGYQMFATDLGTPDHWAEIDVTAQSAELAFCVLLVRCPNASTKTFYEGFFYPGIGGEWGVNRIVAGSSTGLATDGTNDPTVTYRIRVEAETIGGDAVIRVYEYVAGTPTLRLSHTDSSGSKLTTGNFVGVRLGADGATVTADNFCCGPL